MVPRICLSSKIFLYSVSYIYRYNSSRIIYRATVPVAEKIRTKGSKNVHTLPNNPTARYCLLYRYGFHLFCLLFFYKKKYQLSFSIVRYVPYFLLSYLPISIFYTNNVFLEITFFLKFQFAILFWTDWFYFKWFQFYQYLLKN